MALPIFGFGKGFGIGIGSRFGQQQKKQSLKKPAGPRRAGPGYITGRGQARGTPK